MGFGLTGSLPLYTVLSTMYISSLANKIVVVLLLLFHTGNGGKQGRLNQLFIYHFISIRA